MRTRNAETVKRYASEARTLLERRRHSKRVIDLVRIAADLSQISGLGQYKVHLLHETLAELEK